MFLRVGGKKYSNCLIFALFSWFKFGGYLVIRKSRWGFWPHFIWCKDLKAAEIEHFQPVVHASKRKWWQHYFVKLFFEGKIKTKDD